MGLFVLFITFMLLAPCYSLFVLPLCQNGDSHCLSSLLPFTDLFGNKKRPAFVIADLPGDDIIVCQEPVSFFV